VGGGMILPPAPERKDERSKYDGRNTSIGAGGGENRGKGLIKRTGPWRKSPHTQMVRAALHHITSFPETIHRQQLEARLLQQKRLRYLRADARSEISLGSYGPKKNTIQKAPEINTVAPAPAGGKSRTQSQQALRGQTKAAT